MDRGKVLLRTVKKANLRNILVAIAAYGVPVSLGLLAYLFYHRKLPGQVLDDTEKENRRKYKLKISSKRIKKGIPPGLLNLGNTCFINCLLQGLASLTSFCQWMYSLQTDKDKVLQESLKDILQVLSNKREIEEDIFTASDVVDSLRAHGWLTTSEQQDTHEFFQVLMSTLDDELMDSKKEDHNFEFQTSSSTSSIIGKVCQYFPVKSLEVQSPFKGMLANRMSCTNCGSKSVRFEPFESISVRIPRQTALVGATLERCLADFVSSERVEGVNCAKCTSLTSAHSAVRSTFKKQLSFAKLPKCLCIHIQRSYMLAEMTYKNCQFVRFTDILDLHPYRYDTVAYNDCSFEASSMLVAGFTTMPLRGGNYREKTKQAEKRLDSTRSLYRLKAVIVHIGDVLDGHFVTYRRAVDTEDQWVYASDEHIKSATKQSVLSKTAYLLFYERTNDITN